MSVTGDPASCSRLGASLRQLAARLRTRHRELERLAHADSPRGGHAAARARRRAAVIDDAVAAAATELDEVGAALQAHSTELAEAVSDARAVRDRAERAGLEERGGRLVPRWGVTGVADRSASSELEQRRAALQEDLDRVEALLRRRRTRLAGTVRRSGAALASHAGALRR